MAEEIKIYFGDGSLLTPYGDIQNQLSALQASYRTNSTIYSIGDVCWYASNLDKSCFLQCVTAGTTASSDPTAWTAAGTTQADGTVTWAIYRKSAITATSPITVTQTSAGAVVSHNTSGITAGIYNQVTIDANGHATAGKIISNLYRQNATAYAAGNVVLGADGLSKSLRLVCKTAGTTASAAPTWTAVNTTVTDGTAVWEIKNAYDLMPIIAVSAAATIADYQLESCVVLSGSTSYTVILPAPTAAGHTLLVRNAGSVAMTLGTPSGTFVGPHGSLVSTFSIPAGVIIGILSTGTDWVIYRYEFKASTLAGYGITDGIANTGSTAISLAINSTDGGLDITVG